MFHIQIVLFSFPLIFSEKKLYTQCIYIYIYQIRVISFRTMKQI